MTSGSRTNLIIGIVLALAVLLGLNIMMQRGSAGMSEHSDHEDEATPAAGASAAPVESMSKGRNGSQVSQAANSLVTLGDTTTYGDAKAPTEVVVGWQMTPEVQADPEKVYMAVKAVETMVSQSGGKLRARIVNVDANPGVAPGVSIGGVTKVAPQPDGSIDNQALGNALSTSR